MGGPGLLGSCVAPALPPCPPAPTGAPAAPPAARPALPSAPPPPPAPAPPAPPSSEPWPPSPPWSFPMPPLAGEPAAPPPPPPLAAVVPAPEPVGLMPAAPPVNGEPALPPLPDPAVSLVGGALLEQPRIADARDTIPRARTTITALLLTFIAHHMLEFWTRPRRRARSAHPTRSASREWKASASGIWSPLKNRKGSIRELGVERSIWESAVDAGQFAR